MTSIDVRFVRVAPGAAADPLTIADLSLAERDVVQRLGMVDDRDRAATARAAARRELARRLGVHPSRVPLATSADGKPFVERSSVAVSWSHSGSWVALAIASEAPVGVDIEQVPREIPLRALALLGIDSIEQFVALEAAGKATGQGLAAPWPADVVVRALPAPSGYVAALAAPDGAVAIDCSIDDDAHGRPHGAGVVPRTASATIAAWGFPGSSYATNLPWKSAAAPYAAWHERAAARSALFRSGS